MRVLVSPRDEVAARGGIRIRRDCGATHRPGLPTMSVQKMSAAGPGRVGEVGGYGLCADGSRAVSRGGISQNDRVDDVDPDQQSLAGKKAWPPDFGGHARCDQSLCVGEGAALCGSAVVLTRPRWLLGEVHGHGLQGHHPDRRVHLGHGAFRRLCRRVRRGDGDHRGRLRAEPGAIRRR